MKPNQVTVSAQIPKELAQAVTEEAVRSDRSFSAVIRVALRVYLSHKAAEVEQC